jgi:small subunit ribosomal protein S21
VIANSIRARAVNNLLDCYCSLPPAPHLKQASIDLSVSCPKNGDVPKSSLLPIGSPGAIGRHDFKIDVGSYRWCRRHPQALKVLKKKMQREGVFREMKLRGHYEKPSEKRVREKAEAIRRARKLARKKLQREGLLPMKPRVIPGAPGRGGPPRAPRF